MKLPRYVKPYPRFINPFGARGAQPPLSKTIWLRQDIYDNLLSKHPDPVNVSILIHEEEHRKNSNFLNSIKYLLPKSRVAEEINAYNVQFSYLKTQKRKWDIDYTAKALSGPDYLWAMNYEDAKKLLEKTWREA